MIKKFRETGSLLDKNRNQQKSSVNTRDTARYSNGYYKISKIFAEIKCTNGYFVRFSPYCGEEDAEILPIRMQVFHELIPRDYAKRVNYC
jgi:hypothetical protein